MSDDEQQQLDTNGKHIKHRRKKNEIEKEFICGDGNCGRKYGTNAALYTHIKNKHGGIPPVGTVKPSSSKKTRDQQGDIMQGPDEEMSRASDVLKDPDFIKFTLLISSLGEFMGSQNIIVREEKEQYLMLEEEKLHKLFQDILGGAQKLYKDSIHMTVFTKRAEQFLKYSSPYWNKNILNELYTMLMFSYIFKGNQFTMIYEDIRRSSTGYKLFSELLGDNKIQQFREFYTTVWTFLQ